MVIAVLFPDRAAVSGMADRGGSPRGQGDAERSSEILGGKWRTERDPEALDCEVVQPAVFACDLAAFAVLESEGIRVDAGAGHSLGEYAALVAAGVLDFDAGLAALSIRAEAMGTAAREQPGAMTAVIGMSADEASDVCDVAGRGDVLAVANENGARQIVLSGSVAAVERAEELARSRGAKAIRLSVAGAFHSR